MEFKNMSKKEILEKHFIHYKEADLDVVCSGDVFFFDTENAPLFPQEIVDKYDLTNVEYDTIDDFKDVSKDGLLNTLIREKKMTTEIYCWQFGAENSNNVYWGNTIQEFIDFIQSMDNHKIENGIKISEYEIYIHNIAWDIEFFKYWFKEKKFKQLESKQDIKDINKNKKTPNSFDITENKGIVHGARIQLEKKKYKVGKSTKQYLTTIVFKDSAKITTMSLKAISEKMIKVDDKFIKNSDEYKYNTVRDPKKFIPTEIEAWYIYCDIYLLKEWYNQFVIPMYIDNGIKPYTISQIAFDSILKETYKDGVLREKYTTEYDKKELTDRQVYERHFCLKYIEAVPLFREYLRNSYKGGHTTASADYRDLAKTNKATISGVSMDITSSYPSQMCNKPLPFGKPYYKKGKYGDYENRDGEKLDYHFITIAFDGFESINPNNQFGLNVKLIGLTDEEKKGLNVSTNESATTNFYKGRYIGKNRITVESIERSKLISRYQNNFIVTVPACEYEEWIKNFYFVHYDKNGRLKNGVIFIDYVSFQSEIGHFKKGLDHFFKMKEDNDKPEEEGGNPVLKENAKTIINSFYGKHCSRRDREQRFYNMEEDVISFYSISDEEHKMITWEDKKLYAVHYGSAVTSWGRVQLRETCRIVGSDKFIYADTDSLKFDMTKDQLREVVKNNKDLEITGINLDSKKLGAWDFEFEFDDFKGVAQKKYIYKKKGEDEFRCKCAGLPEKVRKEIKSKEDFSIGSEFIKKSKRKVVGGNLLVDISYKIQDFIQNEDDV